MGSPLGLTLANFFLAHVQKKMFEMNLNYYPKLYLRYVDDIFSESIDNNSCSKFLDLLNSQDQNTKFIVKRPSTTIPFLDVKVTLKETGINSKIWRKPTHTGLLLNLSALCGQNGNLASFCVCKIALFVFAPKKCKLAPPIYCLIKK